MRSLVLLFLFALWSGVSIAQPIPPTAIKGGIGLTFYSAEKERTPTIHVAFLKDFFPKTAIELSVEWAMPIDYQLEVELGELQTFRFGLSFLYKVLENRNQILQLGFGLSGGLYDRSYQMTTSGAITQIRETNLHPGFLLLAEYHYLFPNDFFLGARASTFRYDADKSGWSVSLITGYRF